MNYPHSTYAQAVYDALATARTTPDETSATANEQGVLLIQSTWHAGRPLNAAQWPNGMRLTWRSNFGWYLEDPASLISRIARVPHIAAPAALAVWVAAAAKAGMYTNNMATELPGSYAKWEQADELAAAIDVREVAGART